MNHQHNTLGRRPLLLGAAAGAAVVAAGPGRAHAADEHPAAADGAATRFDAVANRSVTVPGVAVELTLHPNGTWPASGSLSPASSGPGSFSPDHVDLAGGSAPLTLSYTPRSAGEHDIRFTSSVPSLRAPYRHPVNCFAPAAGNPVAITSTISFRDQRTFQQDVWTGTAAGFTGLNGADFVNGWGEFFLPVTPAAPLAGLFARLVDAYSPGATPTGGGTVISSVAQVYGPVARAVTARLLLPASDYALYLEVASDAAMTQPVRIPIRFFIRDVALVVTRSMENMLFGSYPAGIPYNTNWSSYTKTTGIGSQNPGGAVDTNGAWVRCDGSQNYGNYGMAFGGVGAQELGRLFAARKGTGLGILGMTPAGDDMDQFWGEDGSPANAIRALMDEAGQKARYLAFESNGWAGVYAPASAAEYRKVYRAIPGRMMTLYPSIAVVSGNSASGQFGSDGSAVTGFTRENEMVREIELTNPAVIAADAGADWNEYYQNSGHASWSSAIRYARARARSMLLAETAVAKGYAKSYADRYTRLAPTGTLVGGVIRIPYLLAQGATKVVGLRWQNGIRRASEWRYVAASPTDLTRLVAVYRGTAGTRDSGAALVPVTGVTINTVGRTVDIAVARGTTGPLTVQFLADFNRYGNEDPAWCASFFDDRDLGDGCGYGPGLRSQLDIAISG